MFQRLLSLSLGAHVELSDEYERLRESYGLHPMVSLLETMTIFEIRHSGVTPEATRDLAEQVVEHYFIHLSQKGLAFSRRSPVLKDELDEGFVIASHAIGEDNIRGNAIDASPPKRQSYAEATARKSSQGKQGNTEDTRPIPIHLLPFVKVGKQYVSTCCRCKNSVGMAVKKCSVCHGNDMDAQYIGNY